jgi:ATP-binding cassette subfamily F protein 3
MIQLVNVSLAFGGQQVFDGLTWTVRPGQRIGLIGPNGAGKSTLLRVITGQQRLDEGSVSLAGGTTLGYLEQDVQELDADRSVVEEALLAFHEVDELQDEEERIVQALEADTDHTTERYAQLLHALEHVHARLVALEVHTLQSRTEAVLTGLGFHPDDLSRPVRTFSGGWRMRVALARLLLRRPDYLLLDEPTNHLDIDSIGWLETYLQRYPGTVVIVSHDRYFLDRMVTSIAELAFGQVTEYAGNYAFYLEARAERRVLQQAAWENQQREIAQTERFIERFRAKATKARQVQSRIKALDRLDRVEAPASEQATIAFRFAEPPRSGRTVLDLSTFSKTYTTSEGPVPVFDHAGPLAIERGDKVALIGQNGAGKSTLLRILNGTEPFEGTCTLGYNVERTYFAQHQADTLDSRHTILESLREMGRGQGETQLRALLGAFLFTGDDVFKPIGVLSGGERSRVALARTLLNPANFLLLDEPTNHLDIQSTAVLIEALRQFAGTFVVVSHDRHFIDQVVNKVWRVEDGTVRTYLGGYSEYLWQVQHGTARQLEAAPPVPTDGPKAKAPKRPDATPRPDAGSDLDRMNAYQLRRAHEQVEAEIFALEARKTELETLIADPVLYTDPARTQQTNQAYQEVEATLADRYARWEQLAERLAAQEPR